MLFFAFLYMRFGELGMSSWRAKHGRRGNVLPHGDDTLRALYCLRFCGCCVYSLITYENENATCYCKLCHVWCVNVFVHSDCCLLVRRVVTWVLVYRWWGRACTWKCPQLAVASSHRVASRNHGQPTFTSFSVFSTQDEPRKQDESSFRFK